MTAYFVGEVDIHDPETYAIYARDAAPIITQHGGEVLAKGGDTLSLEGTAPADRVVIIRFPSMKHAEAFRDSEAYRRIIDIRKRSAQARVYLVEGAT